MTNVPFVQLVAEAAQKGEQVSLIILRSALREKGFTAHSQIKHEKVNGFVTATRLWQTPSQDFPFRVPCGSWDVAMLTVEQTKQAAEFFETADVAEPAEA